MIMTRLPAPEDDVPTPPAWWLASAREPEDDRHAGPNAEQADEDQEPRVFSPPLAGRRPPDSA